jgi:ABC-type transport system substrate-binding protein/DNA-binding SARP family transcriptional activator
MNAAPDANLEFLALGPIAVRRDGQELPLGGPRQRALLALLLLHANQVVSRDRLIDGLWGERPPPTAAHTLDNYISRLRKLLGDGRISTRSPGYALDVRPGELDLDRFERAFEAGREHLARGEASEAAETLRSALAVWRGHALADVLAEPFAPEEAARLEERRTMVLEERIEADLELGRSAELVPELEKLVREHPHRERPLAQLMRALYRAGRQSEALAAYQLGRRRLADELGLDPGPELQELQRKILDHDPSLAAAAPARPPPRRERRRLQRGWLLVGVAAVIASAAIGVVLVTGGTGASNDLATSSKLVRLGSGGHAVELDSAPAALAAGGGSIWLAEPNEGRVTRVDLETGATSDRVPVRGEGPSAIAIGGGSVWAASVPGDTLTRIDPASGTVTQRVPLGGARASALAWGGSALWIADVTSNALIGLDPTGHQPRRTLQLPLRPSALAAGSRVMWVADYDGGLVAQVELRRGRPLTTTRVGNGPAALAVGFGAAWVANELDSTVSRIDPTSGDVTATIPVDSGPSALVVAGGSVWVASLFAGTVSRIDPDHNNVVRVVAVGGGPTALAADGATTWVGVRPLTQHRGGTLELRTIRPHSIDPAVQADLLPLQSDALTRDGLLTYNREPGPAGTRLVPDLAISIPAASDGGTTYTFRLREGIRYSDGRPLRAADFRRAIERVFRLRSAGSAFFTGLVGAETCRHARAQCDLRRGIITDESARTVTYRLRAPDPDFLHNLTEHGFATAVPANTPFRNTGSRPIPGTGPYKIASASKSEIRYVRNPFFREWSHAAQPDGNPDEIVMRFGRTPEQTVRDIRDGHADWSADSVPAKLLPELRTGYASQLRSFAIPVTDFFQLSTTLAPFDDVRVRQALNLAIDRREVVRLAGGPEVASPTCQVLPPGNMGYRRYCPYPRDIARAKRLVAASGTSGSPVTVWGWTDDAAVRPRLVQYVAGVLRELGYRVRVHLVPHAFLDPMPKSLVGSIQLIPAGEGDPTSAFFATWFSCAGANSHGWFCSPPIDRQMDRAKSLQPTDPRAAAAVWAKVDRELVDRAAWVPLFNERVVDFVSARAHNYQFHPYWGFMADQAWLS